MPHFRRFRRSHPPLRPSSLAMPSFGWRYSDAEIATLATYVRQSWGNHAPAVTQGEVKRLRELGREQANRR